MQGIAINIRVGTDSIQFNFNPSVTARVKNEKKIDILAKAHVYLVHIKVEHCRTLYVVSTFTGQNESTIFNW